MWGGGLFLRAADLPLEPQQGGDRLDREGKGQVFGLGGADGRDADAGWLEARTVNDTEVTCWFWMLQAEAVLDMNALRRTTRRT